PEEMEIIVSVGLELGTAIERMQNKEDLKRNEMKNKILFEHIPFSIFKISKQGRVLEIKLDKKIKGIIESAFTTENIIGNNITNLLPQNTAEKIQEGIEYALMENESKEMKFVLSINNNQILFHSNIVPLGENEVFLFLQNVTRTW
ncbi:MAG: hypothetical protein ACFFD7_02170, partial [Candidatus Thorarchaeota archaeon]